jgi:hypothetical protein
MTILAHGGNASTVGACPVRRWPDPHLSRPQLILGSPAKFSIGKHGRARPPRMSPKSGVARVNRRDPHALGETNHLGRDEQIFGGR